MPRYLALEWDSREIRLAVASGQRGEVIIERAITVALGDRESGGPGAEPAGTSSTDSGALPEVGPVLAELLERERFGRTATLVAVGRASIELRLLALPPAPDEELPDLARFQAVREFNTLGDEWPLDFTPLDADPTQPRNVLAAAISPQLVGQITRACKAAGLVPSHLVLRPSAAASLLRRLRPVEAKHRVRLLVDLLADEADLTVLAGETVVFMRTVRLGYAEGRTQLLLNEIRRTIAAVRNQPGGGAVQRVYLCGLGDEYNGLADEITDKLKLSVEMFNPFDGLRLGRGLAAALPENAGRFAPLLGMLLDEAHQTRHAFDFLHPARRPAPPSRRRTYGIAAAAAAVLVVALAGGTWAALDSRDRQIESLRLQVEGNKPALADYAQLQQQMSEIDRWLAGDIVWLDELAELSKQFPPADQAVLTRLHGTTSNRGTSMMLDGVAASAAAVTTAENQQRQNGRRVDSRGISTTDRTPQYPVQFGTTVTLKSIETRAAVPSAPRRPGPRP